MTYTEQIIFGKNLHNLRKKHGLTQRELAKIMGIGVQSLQRIERGTFPSRFYATHLYALVEYFQISADSLFEPTDQLL